MVYLHSPSSRQLAVPGIAFLQAFAGDRGVFAPGPFRGTIDETLHRAARNPSAQVEEEGRPPQLIDFFAGAFVVFAVTFGPVLAWLLLHVAGEAG